MGISAEDKRKKRKDSIFDLVKSSGSIELGKLMGLISNKTGLTYETITKMVNELCDADLIQVENNQVMLPK